MDVIHELRRVSRDLRAFSIYKWADRDGTTLTLRMTISSSAEFVTREGQRLDIVAEKDARELERKTGRSWDVLGPAMVTKVSGRKLDLEVEIEGDPNIIDLPEPIKQDIDRNVRDLGYK
jgi:hypothetical protein